MFALSALRFGYRYFRYSRVRRHARTEGASSTLLVGRAADAEVLLRGIESGAVKQLWPVGVLSPSAADRGQSIRNVPVLGGIDDVEDVIRDYAGRGKPISRLVMTPSAFEPEAHPEAVLMRAKRMGLLVSRLPSLESGDVPRLTNVAVEDLLLRPSEKIDYARLETLVKGKAVTFSRFPPRSISAGPASRFESHDAEVRKSRRRQPALSAGSEHDGCDHGRDIGSRGSGSRGAGALGDGKLRIGCVCGEA